MLRAMRAWIALLLVVWAVGMFLGSLSGPWWATILATVGALLLLYLGFTLWVSRARRCPWCDQHGRTETGDDAALQLQGRSGRRAIARCNNCGNGMLVPLLGGTRRVDPEAWSHHQSVMSERFDSPEAKNRRAAEIDEALRRIDEEASPE